METQAYSYLIGWSSLNKYYYGVRTAKGCQPNDLWVKYFTSSKTVKRYRIEHGEPDIVEVRRLHPSREVALKWEETVIRRLKVVKDNGWLNLQNAGKFFMHNGFPRSAECREKIRQKRLHRLDTDPVFREACVIRARAAGSSLESRTKIGMKAKERYKDVEYAQHNIDTHNTEEYKQRTSEIHKKQNQDPVFKAKHLASVNTPEYRKKQANDSKARMQDPAARKRISEKVKEQRSSPEYRQLMSERAKASTAKRLESRMRNSIIKNPEFAKSVLSEFCV